MSSEILNKIVRHSKAVRFAARIVNSKTTKVIVNVKNEKPEIVSVVSPYFRGVRSATREIVSDMIEISNIYSRKKAKDLAKLITSFSPTKVLISGYAQGHEMLAEELKATNSKLRIFVLVHSAFIWFDTYPAENYVFERFIKLAEEGVIEKIGFCKRDLAEYFKTKDVNTYFVMNRFYPEKHSPRKIDKKLINIGIFGQNQWHRNITNQVIGALMVDNTRIHVNEVSGHSFIDKNRVVVYGILPKEEFVKIYKDIDINMYVSMTDCFPMVLIESMQYGIPCLASDTSDVYAFSPKLKSWLTVSSIDSPIGISKKIIEVIDNYDDIQAEIKRYLPILKEKVEESIKEFLK